MDVRAYLEQIERVNASGCYKADWESFRNYLAPAWFSRAKFGIFIHWGVFTVPEMLSEWYPRHMYRTGSPENLDFRKRYGNLKEFGYKDLIPLFTAPQFNADEWLDLFAEAGARYITPVAEHHDGFQMYKSELSRYNAYEMGPKRDVVGELKAAAEKRGITFCVSSHRAEHYWFMNGGREFDSDVNDPAYDDFYGPAEWTEDLQGGVPRDYHSVNIHSPRMREHCENWLARTAELIDRYRPSLLYFDFWIDNKTFAPYLQKIAAYYYNRAREWGKEVTISYKHDAFPPYAATFDVERGQLNEIRPSPWQTDTSIAKNSWCYTKKNSFKSASTVVEDLIDIVSKNGCMLLNVGPMACGKICKEEEEVLRGVGRFLKVNGEGIYASVPFRTFGEGPTPVPEGEFCDTSRAEYTPQDIRYTKKDGNVYAFILSAKAGISGALFTALKGVAAERADILGFEGVSAEPRPTERGLQLQFSETVKSEFPVCVRLKLRA